MTVNRNDFFSHTFPFIVNKWWPFCASVFSFWYLTFWYLNWELLIVIRFQNWNLLVSCICYKFLWTRPDRLATATTQRKTIFAQVIVEIAFGRFIVEIAFDRIIVEIAFGQFIVEIAFEQFIVEIIFNNLLWKLIWTIYCGNCFRLIHCGNCFWTT